MPRSGTDHPTGAGASSNLQPESDVSHRPTSRSIRWLGGGLRCTPPASAHPPTPKWRRAPQPCPDLPTCPARRAVRVGAPRDAPRRARGPPRSTACWGRVRSHRRPCARRQNPCRVRRLQPLHRVPLKVSPRFALRAEAHGRHRENASHGHQQPQAEESAWVAGRLAPLAHENGNKRRRRFMAESTPFVERAGAPNRDTTNAPRIKRPSAMRSVTEEPLPPPLLPSYHAPDPRRRGNPPSPLLLFHAFAFAMKTLGLSLALAALLPASTVLRQRILIENFSGDLPNGTLTTSMG